MKCPACKGKGILIVEADTAKKRLLKAKRICVLALLAKGFGMNETKRIVGYKWVGSIQKIIKSNENHKRKNRRA